MNFSMRLALPSLTLLMGLTTLALAADTTTNLYVLAYAPAGTKMPMCSPQTLMSKPSWWVENPDRTWTRLVWPPVPFRTDISTTEISNVDLVVNCDMVGQTRTTIYLGLGNSADEMLGTLNIRAIYTVPPEGRTNLSVSFSLNPEVFP